MYKQDLEVKRTSGGCVVGVVSGRLSPDDREIFDLYYSLSVLCLDTHRDVLSDPKYMLSKHVYKTMVEVLNQFDVFDIKAGPHHTDLCLLGFKNDIPWCIARWNTLEDICPPTIEDMKRSLSAQAEKGETPMSITWYGFVIGVLVNIGVARWTYEMGATVTLSATLVSITLSLLFFDKFSKWKAKNVLRICRQHNSCLQSGKYQILH